MNHIDAMLALVDKLIPVGTAAQMKTADWLMIVLSGYFHDLGMVVTKKVDPEKALLKQPSRSEMSPGKPEASVFDP